MSRIKLNRKINGDTWTIQVVNTKQMKKLRDDGEDLAGLCSVSDKAIYIHRDNITFGVVVHELFHAYVSYLHLNDTNDVSLDDLEEIYAGFFTAKAEKIIRQAKRITKDLLKTTENK